MANNAGAITTRRLLSCKDFTDILNTVERVQAKRSFAQPLLLHCRLKEGIKFLKLTSVRKFAIEKYVNIGTCTDELDNEINIINTLRKKIVDTGISPCIVDLEGGCRYDIPETVKELKLDCVRIGRRLRPRIHALGPRDDIIWSLCEWQYLVNVEDIQKYMYVQVMEYCDMTLAQYLSGYHDTYVEFMIFKSILFMVIYTMYQIRKIYPQFRHNDLHTDNIMLKLDPNFVFDPTKPEFLVFNDDVLGKYTIPYYGMIPKIIDFGFSVIPEEKICPILSLDESFMGSRFKEDVSSMLYHIYEDLGHHRHIANLLAIIDPELTHTEAMFTARINSKNAPSYKKILQTPIWKEFQTAKVSPEQIREEYNSPPKTK